MNKRICFVGDSITENGGFANLIWRYLLLTEPKKGYRVYNCGVGGDKAPDIIDRIERDVLPKQPQTAIVMTGMNDANVPEYTANYRENIEKIIALLGDIEIILCTPTPYDAGVRLDREVVEGKEALLADFAQIVREVAQEKGLKCVDIHAHMTALNQKMQKIMPEFTLCGIDRVHPSETGHMAAAYYFLQEMGLYDPNIYIGNTDELDEIIRAKKEKESQLRIFAFIRRHLLPFQGTFEEFEVAYLEEKKVMPHFEGLKLKLENYKKTIHLEADFERELEELIDKAIAASGGQV